MSERERDPAAERFFDKVDKSDGCWTWTGGDSDRKGYGRFNANGRSYRAHRWSWRYHNGPIPDSRYVCHHCDNPSCVRPDHLFLGNARINNRDRHRKGRSAMGESIVQSVLTAESVEAMRVERAERGTPVAELAERLGIGDNTARDALTGKTWKHVGGPIEDFGVSPDHVKLSTDEVDDIRRLAGSLSHRDIAERYSVSRQHVSAIIAGRRWS